MKLKNRSKAAIVLSILKYTVLGVGAIIMILPFFDMFIGALRTPAERLARPPIYWPKTPQWSNYQRVFTELPMLRWYLNSIVVTCAITFIQLLTSSMAGFALAKYDFKGKKLLFNSVLAAQMFPFFLFLIPLFFLMRFWPLAGGNNLFGLGGTGFLGTYTALIFPFMISWYGIFLMRQFMVSIPTELMEAARIDGASEFRIYTHIVLPLIKPALATLGIFIFIYHWNEFIWTMTITRTANDLQTLPVGIFLLRGAFQTAQTESLQQAALAVSVVPLIILFLALQRFYIRGLATSGIKG
ncbi:MAG: carbohydrate ABC transporter permease [Trueperaceae bacterium]|nr:carbohydrate ABC transporter permease [Trueperaceae bacterium]